MNRERRWTRRSLLQGTVSGALGLWTAGSLGADPAPPAPGSRLRQSVARWCHPRVPLEELAAGVAAIGYRSIELITPEEFPTIKAHGLTCAMLRCGSTREGLNRTDHHDVLEAELRRSILFAASEGIPAVACFSGNRGGMSDEEGLENCTRGLGRVVGLAEDKGVTLCMEGLNSRIDHPDHMFDRTAWGAELVRRIDSPRFRLLYDIYHMQIMEGDIIRTIRQYKDLIAHYHTGGVPGRHEIDHTQELNYPAIIRAIVETGYPGWIGQEFIPLRGTFESLEEAFRICAVP